MKRIGKTPPPKRLVGCELIALAARDPAAFVETCEQRYHDRLDAVAQKALEAGVQIIMLTGPSAAGKTTTAHKLADRIAAAGVRSAVMSLDDFFVGEGRYPKQPDGSDDYECVEALDLPVLRGCLRSLAETGVCDAPVFSFLQQRPTGETHRIDARGGIAIVEGLHAFNPALAVDELPDSAVPHPAAIIARQRNKTAMAAFLIFTSVPKRRKTADWKMRYQAHFPISSPAFLRDTRIIKKSRPPQKSRLVTHFLPKG